MNNADYTEEEIDEIIETDKILINTKEKKITPADDYFFYKNTICPQIRLQIVEFFESEHIEYEKEPYNGFIDYCSTTYPKFNFEKKYYTLANYTYPVPIRAYPDADGNLKIDVFNRFVNFIFNDVMNPEEQHSYLNTKQIIESKIIQLCDRINGSTEIKRKILE